MHVVTDVIEILQREHQISNFLGCDDKGKTRKLGAKRDTRRVVFARLDIDSANPHAPAAGPYRMRVFPDSPRHGSLRSCLATACTAFLLGGTLTAAIELNLDDTGQ